MNAPQAAIIDVDHLTRRFNSLVAVDGIVFSVRRGEVFGFLGPNGAGKTTTLKMLCTLLPPSAGRATVNGFDIVRDRPGVRRSLGMIFQDSSLDDRLTAQENLLFHAMIYKVPKALRQKRIDQALALVELTDKASTLTRHFSGGMKRRLEIARALLHEPAVMFLDEPTVGLDPQTRRRIWEFLKSLNKDKGVTLLLTTHYLEEAEVCDRIAIIDQGRIVALDTPEALKRQVGKDQIELESPDLNGLARELQNTYPLKVTQEASTVRLEVDRGDEFLTEMIPRVKTPLTRINLRKPTLDDVFIHLTGRAIRSEDTDDRELMRNFFRRRGHK